MEHKTRTKALSWLLSLAMVLSLIPGMSMTAYADAPKYALTFSANGRTVTPHKGALPITFNSVKGDLPYGEGALDDIIGQLYGSPGTCAQVAPTVIGGSDAVTAGLDNNNYQYITINQFFNGTVTVTGKFTTSNDDEINYSVSITCAGFAGACGFPQRARLPARLGINACQSGNLCRQAQISAFLSPSRKILRFCATGSRIHA